MNLFQSLGGQTHWIWICIGVLLCAGEMFAPGVFLLFIGLAAIATGIVLAIAPLGFFWSIILFAVFAAIAVYLGQRFYGSRNTAGDQPFLNRRADGLVGKTFALDEAIRGGEGAIRVSDTKWRVRGLDMPSGTKVRVTGIEDTTVLIVEQV